MIIWVPVMLAGVVLLMLIRVPIAIAFGAGGLVLALIYGVDPVWAVSASLQLELSFTFLTLPLYLTLGALAGSVGVGDRLSDLVVSLIGRLRGGLGVAVVVTNGIFGAISGAAVSALAGIGKSFVPSMEKAGYPRPYSAALLISSAVLSLLIPPSGTMVIFGFMGQLPITLCFLAPFFSGLVLMFLLSATHLVMARNVPTIYVPPKVSFRKYSRRAMKSAYPALPSLLLPVIVLGGIYGGIFTPLEAAALGVVYLIIIGFFIHRILKIRQFVNDLQAIIITIGSIVGLIFFFMVLSRVLIMEKTTEQLLAWMLTVSTNPWVLMGMLNVFMLIMGMVMDDASGMIVAAVILLPIARAMGFDPFHFAAIAAVNLGLGLITPPVALLLYVGEKVAEVPLQTYIKRVFVYIVFAYLPTLTLTVIFPPLSTFLPHLFLKVPKPL